MIDYAIDNFFHTIWSYVLTRLVFPKARLVRRPIYIRGKKGIVYGTGLTTGVGCRFDASSIVSTLIIGENARFGDYVHINANESVIIGDNLLTASKVFISDSSHGIYQGKHQDSPNSNPNERTIITNPVVIGNNVWIGENAVILPGSRIGNGCVIGANTVVCGGTYPDGSMLVGAPATIIKQYNINSGKWERVNNGG